MTACAFTYPDWPHPCGRHVSGRGRFCPDHKPATLAERRRRQRHAEILARTTLCQYCGSTINLRVIEDAGREPVVACRDCAERVSSGEALTPLYGLGPPPGR